MPTNFELKRLKLKLDIVEKPENRVHKLTDSNGALRVRVRVRVTVRVPVRVRVRVRRATRQKTGYPLFQA